MGAVQMAVVNPKVSGKVFRIGHLGDFNDLTLLGTLGGVEMALGLAGSLLGVALARLAR